MVAAKILLKRGISENANPHFNWGKSCFAAGVRRDCSKRNLFLKIYGLIENVMRK